MAKFCDFLRGCKHIIGSLETNVLMYSRLKIRIVIRILVYIYEPRLEKTSVLVSDLVRHKPGCTNQAVTAKLICVFVFAYAKRWFSHEAAHIYVTYKLKGIGLQRLSLNSDDGGWRD